MVRPSQTSNGAQSDKVGDTFSFGAYRGAESDRPRKLSDSAANSDDELGSQEPGEDPDS